MAVRMKKRQQPPPALQIAPMIDVVFLLLIYFMVSSSIERQEADIGFQLPGVVEQSSPLDLPDEQVIEIGADGQVVLNERRLGGPDARDLGELAGVLSRFREACEANKVEAAVTVRPAPETRHQAIVRVMDAIARAGVKGVSFAVEEEEG